MAHVQTESEWELEMCGRITEYLASYKIDEHKAE